jgi:hypothetical protein
MELNEETLGFLSFFEHLEHTPTEVIKFLRDNMTRMTPIVIDRKYTEALLNLTECVKSNEEPYNVSYRAGRLAAYAKLKDLAESHFDIFYIETYDGGSEGPISQDIESNVRSNGSSLGIVGFLKLSNH